MFIFTVLLILGIETAHHKADHSTRDPDRRRALQAIWGETAPARCLLIMGIVAFLLILSAEIGLTT
eukprot:gene8849-21779_t